MKTNINKNLIYSFAHQVLLVITPLITTPYLARVLTATNVGIFSYTYSFAYFAGLFAQLGLNAYGVRVIAVNREDKYDLSKNFYELAIMNWTSTFIWLIIWAIFCFFMSEYKMQFIIWSLSIFFVGFDVAWFFVGIEHFEHIMSRHIIFRILYVIATLLFVKKAEDLNIYIVIYILTIGLSNTFMWLALPKYLMKVSIRELDVVRHLRRNIVYFLPSIITSIYVVLDKTVLGVLIEDKRESGYYEEATKLLTFAKTIAFVAINRVFEPKAANLYSHKQYDDIKKIIATSLSFIMFVGYGFIFAIIGIGKNFVPIFFGEEYEKVAILISLMSPLVIITGITCVLDQLYYNAKDLKKQTNFYLLVGAILNFTLNFYFISRFMSIGAVLTTLFAEFVICILYFVHCEKYLTIQTIFDRSIKKVIAGALMLISILAVDYILLKFANVGNMAVLIVQMGVGFIVYMVVLFVLKDDIFMFIKHLRNNFEDL